MRGLIGYVVGAVFGIAFVTTCSSPTVKEMLADLGIVGDSSSTPLDIAGVQAAPPLASDCNKVFKITTGTNVQEYPYAEFSVPGYDPTAPDHVTAWTCDPTDYASWASCDRLPRRGICPEPMLCGLQLRSGSAGQMQTRPLSHGWPGSSQGAVRLPLGRQRCAQHRFSVCEGVFEGRPLEAPLAVDRCPRLQLQPPLTRALVTVPRQPVARPRIAGQVEHLADRDGQRLAPVLGPGSRGSNFPGDVVGPHCAATAGGAEQRS